KQRNGETAFFQEKCENSGIAAAPHQNNIKYKSNNTYQYRKGKEKAIDSPNSLPKGSQIPEKQW
ncbi:6577_t:CDS:1, partial [Ambispora gerdemannii]